MSFSNPNILPGVLPTAASPIEAAPALSGSPNVLAQAGAKSSIDAAGIAVKGVLGTVASLLPIAGIGFLTWWGFDMVTGGMLSGKKRA